MNDYDIIVVGGGHAGVEAALVCARRGFKTALITGNRKMIASMPCNPSLGGPAKGIVVREIDALGGQMAQTADQNTLQIKILNLSRGPGVQALRAQIDKITYQQAMQQVIATQANLTVIEALVGELLVQEKKVLGVVLTNKKIIKSAKTIVTTGTYLRSLIFQGQQKTVSGPDKQQTTNGISEQLLAFGFKLNRLKTGTPARILNNSIDYSSAKKEIGTNAPIAFCRATKVFIPISEQLPCWLIHSTEQIHQFVTANLHLSPMYEAKFQTKGPRYCPSFEDKVVKFADKKRHQIFLEPESRFLNTIYLQGYSTSMPSHVQKKMITALPGFADAKIIKYGYAIEYDALDPTQLNHTLETKILENLYTAGQINGSSGYEEAACQGLMAGLNATLKLEHKPPFILQRHEAYIGVLIDDLVLKGTTEPYRLLTSRAEHRLLLRNDNADFRLKKYAYQFGLITTKVWQQFQNEVNFLNQIELALATMRFTPKSKLAKFLQKINHHDLITQGISGVDLIKRPAFDIKWLFSYVEQLQNLSFFDLTYLTTKIRFAGYLDKENKLIARANKWEAKKIPASFNYNKVANLSLEAREKLTQIKPLSIRAASQISGVSPADIQMLIFHFLKEVKKQSTLHHSLSETKSTRG